MEQDIDCLHRSISILQWDSRRLGRWSFHCLEDMCAFIWWYVNLSLIWYYEPKKKQTLMTPMRHIQVDDGWRNADTCSYRVGRCSTTTWSLQLRHTCLLNIASSSYLNIESQQRFLALIPRSLTSDSAELLEQGRLGRAMLWSKLKGYRYQLDQLHQVNRQLADELGALGVELERGIDRNLGHCWIASF